MNIQWYKIATQTGVIKEALRTLKGYDGETEDREIRSLVNFEFSKYDEVIYVHPELGGMLKKDDDKKKPDKREKKSKEVENGNVEESDNPVINIYKKQFGKKPRKDGVFGSCVISLPRTIGRTEEDFPDIALMSVNEAKKAMGQFYATYEYGKVWLKKAVECFIELLGIRDKDVLYIVLHVDESTVHIHCGFFPAYKIKDKNKNVRKDMYGKEIYGCDRSIVSRGFLQSLHTKMVEKMKKEKNMEYAECLLTGEGYYFDPQKMTRAQKEAAERALIEDEILQAKIDKGMITEEEAEGKFHYRDYKLKNKVRLIKEKEDEKKKLINNIDNLNNTVSALNKDKLKLEKDKDGLEKEIVLYKNKIESLKDNVEILEKNYTLQKMDLENQLEVLRMEIKEIVGSALEKFRIDALGMSREEAEKHIQIISSELEEKIEGEIVPCVEIEQEIEEGIEDREE